MWVGYSPELEKQSDRFNETNDCAVLAWAHCFDCSYEKAHAYLKRHGRLDRRGMRISQLESALSGCRKAKIKKGPYTKDNTISLKKFIQKHNVGRYYVIVSGHAFAVVDGNLYDFKEGYRRRVRGAWRIYLEGEI